MKAKPKFMKHEDRKRREVEIMGCVDVRYKRNS
jgi:hypothetical protein